MWQICLACVARGTREVAETVHELDAMYTGGVWEHVSYPMKPILFRKCRSEKEDSDGGGNNEISVALVAHEAHGRFC